MGEIQGVDFIEPKKTTRQVFGSMSMHELDGNSFLKRGNLVQRFVLSEFVKMLKS